MRRKKRRDGTTDHERIDLSKIAPGAVVAMQLSGGEVWWIAPTLRAQKDRTNGTITGVAIQTSTEHNFDQPPSRMTLGYDLQCGEHFKINGLTSFERITKLTTFTAPKLRAEWTPTPNLGARTIDLGREQAGTVCVLESFGEVRTTLVPTLPIVVGAQWVRGMFVSRQQGESRWHPPVSPYDCSVSRLVGSGLSVHLTLGDSNQTQEVANSVLNVVRDGMTVQ